MLRFARAACLALALPLLSAAEAADRSRLGYGRLLTNDFIGDGEDRWRSGSVASSWVWGPKWTGSLPDSFGALIELRLNAEIISPDNLTTPAVGDRPYAGSFALGLHSHYRSGGYEMAVGADLVAVGPSTGLDGFQDALHDLLNISPPSDAVRANQIGDGLHPTLVVEVGRTLSFGQNTRLRPFVEGRAGAETLLRAGVDLTFGQMGQGELLVRDPVTGHRYRTITRDRSGYSMVLGGDVAHVSDSVFLPSDRGFTLTDTRTRVRAGVQWQGANGAGAFYGLTWLGEEFEGQGEGQLTGSFRLHIKF